MRKISKMNRIMFLSITSLALIAAGCRKKVEMPDAQMEKLLGKWEWIATSGGISGSSSTPASEGHSRQAEFTNKGFYYTYEDNHQLYKMTFKVTKEMSNNTMEEAFLLKAKDRQGIAKTKEVMVAKTIEFEGNDTLVLTDNCVDCYREVYKRIK